MGSERALTRASGKLQKMFGWKKPLLYNCNQCGECCRQMLVPLSDADFRRLRRRFPEQPPASWVRAHPIEREHPEAVWLEDRPHLLMLRSRPETGCIFLREGSCGVYTDRPRVCRTWPLDLERQRLRISPAHELLVATACDRTPFTGEAEVRREIRATQLEYTAYRARVRQWNQEMRPYPERQTLAALLAYLEISPEEETPHEPAHA